MNPVAGHRPQRSRGRSAHPTRYRPAVWSPRGVEPLDGVTLPEHLKFVGVRASHASGGFQAGLPPTGTEAELALAAVHEAIRRPLTTVTVHCVAERALGLSRPDDIIGVLDGIEVSTTIGRLRLVALAEWLWQFGVDGRQEVLGAGILAALDLDPRKASTI